VIPDETSSRYWHGTSVVRDILLSRLRALLLAKELSGVLNRGIFVVMMMAYSASQAFPAGASAAIRDYFLLASAILVIFWTLEKWAFDRGLAWIERSLLQIELQHESPDTRIWASTYADMKYDLERSGPLAILLRSTRYEPLIWLLAAIAISFIR
jgi:hypothetical protein